MPIDPLWGKSLMQFVMESEMWQRKHKMHLDWFRQQEQQIRQYQAAREIETLEAMWERS